MLRWLELELDKREYQEVRDTILRFYDPLRLEQLLDSGTLFHAQNVSVINRELKLLPFNVDTLRQFMTWVVNQGLNNGLSQVTSWFSVSSGYSLMVTNRKSQSFSVSEDSHTPLPDNLKAVTVCSVSRPPICVCRRHLTWWQIYSERSSSFRSWNMQHLTLLSLTIRHWKSYPYKSTARQTERHANR